MAIGLLIAFALGTVFGYIMCAVLSANTTDEEWQKIAGVPVQPTAPPMPSIELPPAQPERIKSKWELHTYMPHNKFCLACRNDSPYNKRWDFCPKCGADMREVTT